MKILLYNPDNGITRNFMPHLQMSKRAWLKLLFDNRKPILSLTKEGAKTWRNARKHKTVKNAENPAF